MTRLFVEPSGESLALARAELEGAVAALGGGLEGERDGLVIVRLDAPAAASLAGRLALARRCLTECPGASLAAQAGAAGADGRTGAVRRLGRPSAGGSDATVREVGAAYVRGGGRIDLENPERAFWIVGDGPDARLFEEILPVDRRAVRRRRISLLPFQRPVGLDPRLARAAANLARVRPGDRVVDPFLGTGALLAEAAALGARVSGVDRDPEMVRGALRNFAFLGVSAEAVVEGDAGAVELPGPSNDFDALLTDPPYGRASPTGGEGAPELVRRVLPRWAGRVRAGGRVVVVLPGGPDPLGPPWCLQRSVPVRVHRSLTREFRVYARYPNTIAKLDVDADPPETAHNSDAVSAR